MRTLNNHQSKLDKMEEELVEITDKEKQLVDLDVSLNIQGGY